MNRVGLTIPELISRLERELAKWGPHKRLRLDDPSEVIADAIVSQNGVLVIMTQKVDPAEDGPPEEGGA